MKYPLVLALLLNYNCGSREPSDLLEEARKEINGVKKFELYDEVISLDSVNESAFFERGSLHAMYYNSSLSLEQEGNDIDSNRTLMHYHSAIADFGTVIRLNPKNTTAYINRARLYSQTNENEKACKDFLKAQNNGAKVDSTVLVKCKEY